MSVDWMSGSCICSPLPQLIIGLKPTSGSDSVESATTTCGPDAADDALLVAAEPDAELVDEPDALEDFAEPPHPASASANTTAKTTVTNPANLLFMIPSTSIVTNIKLVTLYLSDLLLSMNP